ncbi:MAG: EAL domain-containing protein [Deltaproteobacteria bacterium]|jgi:diguanylate cyclase (GGDEF)-like protein|nr:EAL domain-containing protein [Deltaproteobacteria bacterium]MBT4525981.1 EAL domain-containing protein [Deltaproteobacteria bacterium]
MSTRIENINQPSNSDELTDSDQKTILVIDDDIDSCEILYELFDRKNYKVLCGINGQEGVRILSEHKESNKPVDVIILDKSMPVMDGLEFLKQSILKDYSLTPIIMLSANLTQKETVEAYRNGIWDSIIKQGDLNIVLERVAIQLDKVNFLKKEAIKQQELVRLIYVDQVTNLPNLKAFFNKYKIINNEIALLIVNLDKFGDINNIYGRPVGDDMLKKVSLRLTNFLGEDHFIARLGGAEFVIIINSPIKDEVIRTAGVLKNTINDTYQVEGLNIHVTASIGISFYPEHGKEITTLLKNANIAASHISAKGNRIIEFDEEMLVKIRQENEIKNDLRHALIKDPQQFRVYYQPVVDRNKMAVGAEALIRWHHPKNGLIPPFKFIPIAEKSEDLMVPLTELVMETVCKKLSDWKSDSFYVSVNISTVDLLSDNFIDKLEALIKQYHLNRDLFKIEITESHIMEDPEKAFNVIKEIKNKCRLDLLIDDFGTGHSALSYLKRFPKETIVKIDQSFIQSMALNDEEKLTLYGIINLALTRNMPIVVEGVDNVPIPKNIFTEIEGINLDQSETIFDDIEYIEKWGRLSNKFNPNLESYKLSHDCFEMLGLNDDIAKQKLENKVFKILKRFSVETIFKELKSFDIHKFQGFFFDKPLTEEDFEKKYINP